jgi:hypothetical protein
MHGGSAEHFLKIKIIHNQPRQTYHYQRIQHKVNFPSLLLLPPQMIILELCRPIIIEILGLFLYVLRKMLKVVCFTGVGLFEGVVGLF